MKKQLNVLIVEDEFLISTRIKKLLIELGHQIIGDAICVEEAIEIIKNNPIDLAILDINLQGQKDGIWLGNFIKNNYDFPFIYLTAYKSEDIILKAVKAKPSAYLMKPFNRSELFSAVELAVINSNFQVSSSLSKNIVLKEKGFLIKIKVEDILYAEAIGNYLHIQTNKKKVSCRMTLKNLLEQLPPDEFTRCHRAFVVNRKQIQRIERNEIILPGLKIPLSNAYKNTLKSFIQD